MLHIRWGKLSDRSGNYRESIYKADQSATADAATPATRQKATASSSNAPAESRQYKVKQGETLNAIAERYNVTTRGTYRSGIVCVAHTSSPAWN